MRMLVTGLISGFVLLAQSAAPPPAATETVPAAWLAASGRISPESLRGHVAFLASDLLEGRATPSRGQDIAALYIAGQFERFGLAPGGNHGFFHDTAWAVPVASVPTAAVNIGGETIAASAVEVFTQRDLTLHSAEAVVWTPETRPALDGKVALFVVPAGAPEQVMGEAMSFVRAAKQANAQCLIIVDPLSLMRSSAGLPRPYKLGSPLSGATATAFVSSLALAESLRHQPGQTLTVSLAAPANKAREFPLRNIVGVLSGADPALRDTYIVISAHYDHIGLAASGEDRVFNGANDDASGVAAVLEIAETLSHLPARPKRSIVFAVFAGEEQGLHGSREFAASGLFPPERITANLNLEVIGRIDAEQAVAGAATITGFDYSSLSAILDRAGAITGVKVMGEPRNSETFFSRSDNVSLAAKGVPAVTISTGYIYPDYHGIKDEPGKLDYPQMAAIARLAAVSALLLADSPGAPTWNEISATKRFRHARGAHN